jgi:hypothetical protein
MLTELSIFLPNEPGRLARLIKELNEQGINIMAISVVETADYGLILLLVDKSDKCVEFLDENNYEFTQSSVLAISFNDEPMDLYNVTKLLGDHEINIEYLYLTVIGGETIIILRVDDNDKAANILQKNGLSQIEESQL